MHAHFITSVTNAMAPYLTETQMQLLIKTLNGCITQSAAPKNVINLFLSAKEVEGCSAKTIAYYSSTIEKMAATVNKPVNQISTDDLRKYLSTYEAQHKSSKTTIDNIRRILSSFFSWLEDEDYIVKSPVRRIHHVKTPQTIKSTISDEEMEILREGSPLSRDRAIINLLASTGMRIGELVGLNRSHIDLISRECIVTGEGNKQRIVYFDAKTKLSLEKYLSERTDSNPALFATLSKQARRLSAGAIELRLKDLGNRLGVPHVHPHKFRRTLATNAIDKGMPIEQVQKLLGHEKIDTTMHYAIVNQRNVKASHRRYLG